MWNVASQRIPRLISSLHPGFAPGVRQIKISLKKLRNSVTATSTGAVAWIIVSWIRGKPSLLGLLGAIAGLIAIRQLDLSIP